MADLHLHPDDFFDVALQLNARIDPANHAIWLHVHVPGKTTITTITLGPSNAIEKMRPMSRSDLTHLVIAVVHQYARGVLVKAAS